MSKKFLLGFIKSVKSYLVYDKVKKKKTVGPPNLES